MVVCEVPEARLSVNDKSSSLREVYFNTKGSSKHSPQQSTDSAVDLHQHRDRKFSISAEIQLSTAVRSRKHS